MGFYSFYKILKDMFRTIFGKHFLKILLLALLLFIGYIVFSSEGVFAVSNIVVDDIFTDEDVSIARNLVGDSIWNNTDYDIYLVWGGSYWRNGSYSYNNNVPDLKYGKYVYYFNTTDSNVTDNNFKCGAFGNTSQYGFTWRGAWFSKYPNMFPQTLKLLYWPTNNVRTRTSDGLEIHSNITNNDVIYFRPIRMRYDLLDDNDNIIVRHNYSNPVSPYFVTTNQELETFDFDYFQINGGTSPYYTQISEGVGGNPTFYLTYNYKGVNTNIDVTNYVSVNESDNTWSINIPYTKLVENVIVRNGETFSYAFTYNPFFGTGYSLSTGVLTYNLTSDQEQQINEDSLRALQDSINQGQQQTTNAVQNLDNTINDSNIDNITNDTLPSDNTQDITQEGVNGIFTSIYNAFCTGTPQDIIFPVPFTDKNITLSPNYVSNMLTTANAGFVITLIQAFWWYLISRFIVKDIMNKINKIKSGNIENIETTNIRGDML